MKTTITSGMEAHLDLTTTTLATCWEITREDGVVFRFTDHDRDILFGGNTYESSASYRRTDIANESGYSVDDLDVLGILDSDHIKTRDLRNGLFDNAAVRIFIVNFKDPDGDGELKLRRGRFGEITVTQEGTFTTELRGMLQSLSPNLTEVYSPDCRADLGDTRCKFLLDVTSVRQNSTAYAIDDRVIVPTGTAGNVRTLPFVNSGFDDASGTAPNGWVVDYGEWQIDDTDLGLNPQAGTGLLRGLNSDVGRCHQDVHLVDDAGLDEAIIVAGGQYTLDLSIYRATSNGNDEGRVLLQYLDADKVVLNTAYDSGSELITPLDTWVERTLSSNAIPTTARYVRVTLEYTYVDGARSNSAFDSLTVTVNDPTSTSLIYENRWYRCTTAGTTAASQPAFNTTIGQTTADGSVVWTAEEARTKTAEVLSVTNNRVFAVSLLDSADDFYNGGKITWLTGISKGRRIEAKDWVLSGKVISLHVPMDESINVGDVFTIHQGCDKLLATCRDTFDNVINFRGEPHLPGQDEFLKAPDVPQ